MGNIPRRYEQYQRPEQMMKLTTRQIRSLQGCCAEYSQIWYVYEHELLYRKYRESYGEGNAMNMVGQLQRMQPWTVGEQRKQFELEFQAGLLEGEDADVE